MNTVVIGLGSNLGSRETNLAGAIIALASLPKSTLMKRGRLVRSAPMMPPGEGAGDRPYSQDLGGEYLNTVAVVSTRLTPMELLAKLQEIETKFGRYRSSETTRWQPRTLDLDVLLYGQDVIKTPELCVPHTGLTQRAFWLEPLAEIMPDVIVPGEEKSVGQLWEELKVSQKSSEEHAPIAGSG